MEFLKQNLDKLEKDFNRLDITSTQGLHETIEMIQRTLPQSSNNQLTTTTTSRESSSNNDILLFGLTNRPGVYNRVHPWRRTGLKESPPTVLLDKDTTSTSTSTSTTSRSTPLLGFRSSTGSDNNNQHRLVPPHVVQLFNHFNHDY